MPASNSRFRPRVERGPWRACFAPPRLPLAQGETPIARVDPADLARSSHLRPDRHAKGCWRHNTLLLPLRIQRDGAPARHLLAPFPCSTAGICIVVSSIAAEGDGSLAAGLVSNLARIGRSQANFVMRLVEAKIVADDPDNAASNGARTGPERWSQPLPANCLRSESVRLQWVRADLFTRAGGAEARFDSAEVPPSPAQGHDALTCAIYENDKQSAPMSSATSWCCARRWSCTGLWNNPPPRSPLAQSCHHMVYRALGTTAGNFYFFDRSKDLSPSRR